VQHASSLLQLLLTLLAVNGVAPDAADPWRGWRTFKQYVRIADEVPDPGVSVQVIRDVGGGGTSLVFLRQLLEQEGAWLEPVGGVVMEFFYPPGAAADHFPEWELWSFDHDTFERFVDCVELHEEFAHLMLQRPQRTRVYWLEA
jgi:hypothetical protein